MAASAFSAHRRVISSRRFAMEADKTISPSLDRVNREGLQGPREDNSSRPVVTVNDGASVWDGCVLGGDLNKNTVGFCSILQERCVIHAAWFSTAALIFVNTVNFGAKKSVFILDKRGNFALGTCNPCLIACKSTLICLGFLEEKLAHTVSLRSYTIEPECIIGTCSILMEGSLVETLCTRRNLAWRRSENPKW
ncbi:gamma carbonic anhydrase-like 1, mitochondrial [Gossypium australe]|uniref:Gamma carbonic anhydrase-like 1, mitochondrial n=1 Tax=Gossypium australe TaxID=47621 RepID=A0A5B6W315_9ROSI|nr:gamma carbonic anhydrase-like 1, mitochondrial [Gossypium australe]